MTNGIFSLELINKSIEGKGISLLFTDDIKIIGGDDCPCVSVSITYFIIKFILKN
jgi:hypothetical protein